MIVFAGASFVDLFSPACCGSDVADVVAEAHRACVTGLRRCTRAHGVDRGAEADMRRSELANLVDAAIETIYQGLLHFPVLSLSATTSHHDRRRSLNVRLRNFSYSDELADAITGLVMQ